MSLTVTCSACGCEYVPQAALKGLCPKCLLTGAAPVAAAEIAANIHAASKAPRFVPPKTSELQPYFDQIEIIELSGHGGMSAVYKARQKSLDRVVALKILPQQVAEAAGGTERFARETKTLARLSHPNVVALLDAGQVGPWCYCLMEFVSGPNLRQLLGDSQLAAADILKLVPDICDGLQYCHDQGIVHRDIKPENILIDEHGRAKIADFGLVKVQCGAERPSAVSATQHIVGTPCYIAPEQMETPTEVDHRADLYSLGVMLYEMLTGEIPAGRFEAPSHGSRAEVSAAFDEIVFRALASKPAQRYQNARDLRDDILASMAVQTPASRPVSNDEHSRWADIVLSLASFALLCAGIIMARESRVAFVVAQREAAFGDMVNSSFSRQSAALSGGASLLLIALSFLTAWVNVHALRSWREASFTQRVTAPLLIAGYLLAGAALTLLPVTWMTLWACIPLYANVESWSVFGRTFSDADRMTFMTQYWLTAIGVGLLISALWTVLCAAALRRWPFVLRTLLRPHDHVQPQTTPILLMSIFGAFLFPVATSLLLLGFFMD